MKNLISKNDGEAILDKRYRFNREEYTQAKTAFIVKITAQQKRKING